MQEAKVFGYWIIEYKAVYWTRVSMLNALVALKLNIWNGGLVTVKNIQPST